MAVNDMCVCGQPVHVVCMPKILCWGGRGGCRRGVRNDT